MEIPGVEVKC